MLGKEEKSMSVKIKEEVFSLIFLMDHFKFTNKVVLLCVSLFQMLICSYFYIHPTFSNLYNFSIFNSYFTSYRQYVIVIVPSNSFIQSIVLLLLSPIMTILLICMKKIAVNYIILLLISVYVLLYPFLFIKNIIEIISLLNYSSLAMLFGIILGIFNILIGVILLAIYSNAVRILDVICVILLEEAVNVEIIMPILAVRLVLLYFLAPDTLTKIVCYFIVITTFFIEDCQNTQLSFILVLVFNFILSGFKLYIDLTQSKNILDHYENLEDQGTLVFAIDLVEEHYVNCQSITCKCRQFPQIQIQQLGEWIYYFQEQRLKIKEQNKQKFEYALACCHYYDFKLSGLLRVNDIKPANILQEYKIFMIRSKYEQNLRKLDKSHKFGQQYLIVNQQIQLFYEDILEILKMIKQFWMLIIKFDGTSKFIELIIAISRSIKKERKKYEYYNLKHQEMLQFKYVYSLFETIILNEVDSNEERQLYGSDDTLFIISNQQKILKTNNSFATYVNQKRQEIIGRSINFYVPQVYKSVHKEYISKFIQSTDQYTQKSIGKCFCPQNGLDMKYMKMSHKIIPRFIHGIQIFTAITPYQQKPSPDESFIILLDKNKLLIMNIENSFYQISKFKYSQRNINLLLEMPITSIFNNFTLNLAENIYREVTLSALFFENFSAYKHAVKQKMAHRESLFKMNTGSRSLRRRQKGSQSIHDQIKIFQYTILDNFNPDDQYLKIVFKVKHQKELHEKQVGNSNQELKLQPQKVNSREQTVKEQIINFRIPIFLILIFGVAYLLMHFIFKQYETTQNLCQKRFQFYLAYDYTILNTLNVYIGINKLKELKALWIEGYGDFPQIFNIFDNIDQPAFSQFFYSTMTTIYHNQLYGEILNQISNNLQIINQYSYILIGILGFAILCFLADLILSIRYIIKVQQKVGQLLLLFLLIDHNDIKFILRIIDNFSKQILNYHQEPQKQNILEQSESQISAHQLWKSGNSANSSISFNQNDGECENIVEKCRASGFRTSERNSKRSNRGSIVLVTDIKDQLKQISQNNQIDEIQQSQSITLQKTQNIHKFHKKYEDISFIFKQNKKLFALIVICMVISCMAIGLTAYYLPLQVNYLQNNIQIYQKIYLAKISILKENSEIMIANRTLDPRQTSGNILKNALNLITQTPSQMNSFQSLFTKIYTNNICSMIQSRISFTCSNLSIFNNTFGISVLSQQIQEYLRIAIPSNLTVNSQQNQLILAVLAALDLLIDEFTSSAQQFQQYVNAISIKIAAVGTLILIVCLYLQKIGLQYFQNRIENANNLLKIVPKEIKQKNKAKTINLKSI